jgi:hypothetical protein
MVNRVYTPRKCAGVKRLAGGGGRYLEGSTAIARPNGCVQGLGYSRPSIKAVYSIDWMDSIHCL